MFLAPIDLIHHPINRNAVARVTRLLIQRIFNDPAFGIQAKIESILVPQPPRPQLPLADYLDALVSVAYNCIRTDSEIRSPSSACMHCSVFDDQIYCEIRVLFRVIF